MIEEDKSLLVAYKLDGKGGGTEINAEEANALYQAKENLLWLHFQVNHPDTRKWLMEKSGLDPLIVDALLANETRPRTEEFEEGSLIILRGVNLNENAEAEDMVSIRMWVDKSKIISVRMRRLKAIGEVKAAINDPERKGPRTTGDFVSLLAKRMFVNMESTFQHLDDLTDKIEEKVLEEPDKSIRPVIVSIRNQAILFRRYMAPQKDAISKLRDSNQKWLSGINKRQLQEAYDHILRYVEQLDAIRERSQVVHDELTHELTERINKDMYILSMVSVVFLPLTFFTGLWGMNVGGIPGAENDHAFAIFAGAMVLVVMSLVALFKKLKWF